MEPFGNWKYGKLVSTVQMLLTFVRLEGGCTLVDHVTLCLASPRKEVGKHSSGRSTNKLPNVSCCRLPSDLLSPFSRTEHWIGHDPTNDGQTKPFVSREPPDVLLRRLSSGPSSRLFSAPFKEDWESKFSALASSSNKLFFFVFCDWLPCGNKNAMMSNIIPWICVCHSTLDRKKIYLSTTLSLYNFLLNFFAFQMLSRCWKNWLRRIKVGFSFSELCGPFLCGIRRISCDDNFVWKEKSVQLQNWWHTRWRI